MSEEILNELNQYKKEIELLKEENQWLRNKLILSKTNLTSLQTRINHLMNSTYDNIEGNYNARVNSF